MARYSKKISDRIQKAKGPAKPVPKKAGRDILLLLLMCINFIFMIAGWTQLSNVDRILYVILEGALLSIYTQRHAKLSEKASDCMRYAAMIFMAVAFVLFIYSCYLRYIAA